jgi:lipoprotein-releasing system ATP-binding protein
MSESLIRAVGLEKSYGDTRRVEVLRGLDLAIERGERVAIVGESGAGKSTLLHILGALDEPTGGEVYFGDAPLGHLDEVRLARLRNTEIGFIFQFHHLLPDFSALENVMMPSLIGGASRAEAEGRARPVLEKVGLAERLDHRPGQLSGGEQQRVAVARAVVLEPKAILADEPTGNLDQHTGEGVAQLLLDLNRDLGLTLVIVTHSQRLAGQMDRILELHDGRLC